MKTYWVVSCFLIFILISCQYDESSTGKPGNSDSDTDTDTDSDRDTDSDTESDTETDNDAVVSNPATSACADLGSADDIAELTEDAYAAQSTLLLDAYNASSEALFDQFLENWRDGITPVSCEALTQRPEVDQEIHRLFLAYYNPFDLAQYGMGEWGNDIYTGAEFVIAQTRIRLDDWGVEDPEIVQDVRPPFSFDTADVLYLTPKYLTLLSAFLDGELDIDELSNRFSFLNTRLRIAAGHWGGFHFISHPELEWVDLSEGMTAATVHFRLIYEGGESEMKKDEDGWRISSSRLTWIE